MERLAAIGLSWRHGDLARVARFTVPEERRAEACRALAARLSAAELVYLATCNRIEVVFAPRAGAAASSAEQRAAVFEVLAGRAPTPGETERTFRAWSGEGAVEHAFLVASGLDSAQLGESEIAGQVRRAVEQARGASLLGPALGALFEEALRLARRVRGATGIGAGRTSLAELALDAVRDRLASSGGPVALIGVSPMTKRVGAALAAEGVPLCVVNRTAERAEELAARLPGALARPLARFRDAPEAVEVVVTATAAPEPVLDRAALERLAARAPSGRPPLIVDLGVPPDVAPADAQAFGIERIGMDALTARAAAARDARSASACDARVLVDEALERWRRAQAERLLAPLLAALQRHYQDTARTGLARLFGRELRGLGERERDAVARWAEALARRFAHLPAAGLRELAADGGTEALGAFFRRADDGLARALEQASREPEEPAP